MNKSIAYVLVFLVIILFNPIYSQDSKASNENKIGVTIFQEEDIMPVKLTYSIKDIKKTTNDSTYITSNISYQLKNQTWQNLEIQLRARGNYRLKNCYFPPLKIKIKKEDSKNTLFEGQKSLKVVLPCLIQKENNDNIIKEYLVYKLFETVSPYYFKTRLLDINFEEIKGNNTKIHQLKGFFIENDKAVAKRLDAKVYTRKSHPLNHDALTSIRNAFFEFMIGNTDFSQAYQHNVKLFFLDTKMIPIPYDFDMSGFVNTSYAVVSQIPGENLSMESVTQRKYRGFVRDENLIEQVRTEFIESKPSMFLLLEKYKHLFENQQEYFSTKDYLASFFDIIMNSEKFKKEILNQLRE